MKAASFARLPAAFGAAVLLMASCSSTPERAVPSPSVTASPSPSSSLRPVPNRTTARWSALADAPAARQEVAAAVVGDVVYVAGGYDASRAASKRVDAYNLRDGRWSGGPALPEGRHHPAAAAYRGQMYLIGGFGPDGAPSDEVFRLDSDPVGWSRVALLNHARGAAAAVVANDKLYVFGGQGASGALVEEPEVFEPDATSRWRDLARIPTPRHHLAADASGVNIYVAGGRVLRDGQTVNVTAFERYDTEADVWLKLPKLPAGRSGHGAAMVEDGLVLVGGEDPAAGGPSIARVDLYSIKQETWSSLPAMPRPKHGVAVVTYGGKIYVFLGAGRAGFDATKQSDVLTLG